MPGLLIRRLERLEERLPTERSGVPATPLWTPLPGPQTAAFESEADELFYGGAAGGGKTDLLLGLALSAHQKSIVFRREYPQLKDIVERSKELVGHARGFNGQANLWHLPGRTLEFGAVQHEDFVAKYKGRAHDLKAFDEVSDFSEAQYRFLTGWARTTIPGQRVRIVAAGNPPTSAEGEWVIQRWAPWLDEQCAHPAEPGELRWYAVVDGEERECEDGEPFEWHGETIQPKSRTFIPARLGDNPYLVATGYGATLQGLPEPLRSQLLCGDFSVGRDDDPWQVIPTEWVRLAQQRWEPERHLSPPDAVGVDIAQGGTDRTVLMRRYGPWFDEPESHPGADVPDANENAQLVTAALMEGGRAEIDCNGVGAATYHLVNALLPGRAHAFIGSDSTNWQDKSGQLHFVNVRAAAYWKMREALDPDTGLDIALPPSRELRADLCAPRWSRLVNGIQLEKKDDIKKRLGRSPDLGDAAVQALWDDPKADYARVIGMTGRFSRPRRSLAEPRAVQVGGRWVRRRW